MFVFETPHNVNLSPQHLCERWKACLMARNRVYNCQHEWRDDFILNISGMVRRDNRELGIS